MPIPVNRVVAVIAETASGRVTAFGAGYLLDATRVLTARHCIIDRETGEPAARLRVQQASDGASATVVVGAMTESDLDVALLVVIAEPPWSTNLPGGPVTYGSVDRQHSGELTDCEGVGFPRWQAGEDGSRRVAEVHGLIRLLDERERQRLVLRDPILVGVAAKDGPTWAGYSGAAVFHGGLLLGVVIEHHPSQGHTALHIRPIQAVATGRDPASRRLAEALGLRNNDAFQPATPGPTRWRATDAGEAALNQWGWSLDQDDEGFRHWKPRARGVGINTERGWQFRGRTTALEKIISWLDDPLPTRKVLVVTGDPGSGKSAVLGRIVTTSDPTVRASLPSGDTGILASEGSVSCAVHAKDKTALDVAEEIARAANARTPREPTDLAPLVYEALSARAGDRFNVIIDALDEMSGSDQASDVIGSVVLPLAQTCSDAGVRVVVGTRRQGDGIDLLARFGPALEPVDLDKPLYFEESDLADYALACLRSASDEEPGSPYVDDAVARPRAERIAKMAGRNFLVAGLVARTHGQYDQVTAETGRLEATNSVRTALEGYLRRLSPAGGVTPSELLTALAFTESPGLPISLWRLAVKTLTGGKTVRELELARFVRSSAANLLVETEADAEPVYRLFHQALSDALLRSRREAVAIDGADDRALARAFVDYGREVGWEHAPAYLLRSLPTHAARAGLADELLTDDAFLLHADLRRMLQVADQSASQAARDRIRLVGLTPEAVTARPAEREALFSVTEAVDDLGTSYRSGSQSAPYRAVWASANPRHTNLTLRAPGDKLRGVCMVDVDGQLLLATGSDSGTVRLWDPESGTPVRSLETGQVITQAMCEVEVSGQPLLAIGSYSGAVGLWNPANGTLVRTLETGQDSVSAACVVGTDDLPLIATSGRYDGTVKLWNPADGTLVRTLETGLFVLSTMCAVEIEGRVLLAIGSGSSTVWLWDPVGGSQSRFFNTRLGCVLAACTVVINGRTLLAVGGDVDGKVELRDPVDGSRAHTVDSGQFRVSAMCEVEVHGEPMLATNGNDGMVQVCGVRGATADRESAARQSVVRTICAVDAGSRPLFASGCYAVQLWNPEDGAEVDVLDGGLELVLAVSPVEVFGRTLLAASVDTGIIRLWSPASGAQVSVLDTGQQLMTALCAITAGGRVLLAAGDDNGTVELWNPEDGTRVRILDVGTEQVKAVCAVEAYEQPLLAVGDGGGMVGLWNPADGTPVLGLDTGQNVVEAVCAVEADGRTLLAVGGYDRTVGLWDLEEGTHVHSLDTGQNWIHAMCVVEANGKPLLVTGGDGGIVHLWDPTNGRCILTVPVHHAVRSAASTGQILAVGLDAGLLAIELNPRIR